MKSRVLKKCLGEQLTAQNIVNETGSYQKLLKQVEEKWQTATWEVTEPRGSDYGLWKPTATSPVPVEPLSAMTPWEYAGTTLLNKSFLDFKINIIIITLASQGYC